MSSECVAPIVCPRRVEPLWRLHEAHRSGIMSDSGYLAFPYQREALLHKVAGAYATVYVRELDGLEYVWEKKCVFRFPDDKQDLEFTLFGYFEENAGFSGCRFWVFDVFSYGGEDRVGWIYKKRFSMFQETLECALEGTQDIHFAPCRRVEDCNGSFENCMNPKEEDKEFPWDCGFRLISKYHSFTFCGASGHFVLPYVVSMNCFVTFKYRWGSLVSVGAYDRDTGEIVGLGDLRVEGAEEGQVVRINGYDYNPVSKKFWKILLVSKDVDSSISGEDCVVQDHPQLSWYF